MPSAALPWAIAEACETTFAMPSFPLFDSDEDTPNRGLAKFDGEEEGWIARLFSGCEVDMAGDIFSDLLLLTSALVGGKKLNLGGA